MKYLDYTDDDPEIIKEEKQPIKKNNKKNQIKMDICLDLFYVVKKSTEDMGVPIFDSKKFGADTFFYMIEK